MLDLIMPAKLRVLILQGVMTVRAGSNDLSDLCSGQGRDIRLRAFLEEKLISYPARGIAGARFFFSKDGKVHPCFPKQFDRRTRDLLRPRVERRGTANPKKVFEFRIGLDRG